jgi:hypothetical protein
MRLFVHVRENYGYLMTKKTFVGILFGFWWQIWNDRNRGVFDQKEPSSQVKAITVQELKKLQLARQPPAHHSVAD